MDFFKRAAKETLLSAAVATVLCLFAAALFAVFVRAYSPSDLTVLIVNHAIGCAASFAASLLFVRAGRALLKGAAAGLAALLFTTIAFGIIGGFHFTPLFLLKLLLWTLFGALGALTGAKIRKE